MTRHSSYSAPRSERSSGSYGGQHNRGSKRNTYNKRSLKDNKTLFTLVCFILPFISINLIILFLAISTPKIEYTISDTQDYKTVDLSIKVRSLLPVKEMSVTLETKPIELVKEKGVYKTTLEDNGTLEILVTGWNGMSKRAYEHIATLDDAPPSIDEDDYVMEDGLVTVVANDSQSGVKYDAAYALDDNGDTIKPISINKDTGEIVFTMDTPSLTVYIEDYAGNIFKASFTSHTEGIDTDSRNFQFPSDGTNGTNGSSDSSTKVSSNKGISIAKETSKAKETTKATKAAEKAKESTKATKATEKAKEPTKAIKATEKAKESTKATKATEKAKESTKATKATEKAKETTNATKETKPVETTAAPAPNPNPAPTTPAVPGLGQSTAPTQAPTQSSQPAAPGSDSNDITIVPIS